MGIVELTGQLRPDVSIQGRAHRNNAGTEKRITVMVTLSAVTGPGVSHRHYMRAEARITMHVSIFHSIRIRGGQVVRRLARVTVRFPASNMRRASRIYIALFEMPAQAPWVIAYS